MVSRPVCRAELYLTAEERRGKLHQRTSTSPLCTQPVSAETRGGTRTCTGEGGGEVVVDQNFKTWGTGIKDLSIQTFYLGPLIYNVKKKKDFRRALFVHRIKGQVLQPLLDMNSATTRQG
ncbi:hypothetical protein ILYODFUR_033379 [Ilyodon furcidens]|uniref:Uncharacterized protein n=1 Tax=Ilyodon furcidens TaxID=33524 RepID=A0ABV0TZV7_9TELE